MVNNPIETPDYATTRSFLDCARAFIVELADIVSRISGGTQSQRANLSFQAQNVLKEIRQCGYTSDCHDLDKPLEAIHRLSLYLHDNIDMISHEPGEVFLKSVNVLEELVMELDFFESSTESIDDLKALGITILKIPGLPRLPQDNEGGGSQSFSRISLPLADAVLEILRDPRNWAPWVYPIDSPTKTFFDEMETCVRNLETGLLTLEENPAKGPELVHELHRSSHNVKGVCGQIGVKLIGKIANEFEHIFSKVRDEGLVIDLDTLDLMLQTLSLFKWQLADLERQAPQKLTEKVKDERLDRYKRIFNWPVKSIMEAVGNLLSAGDPEKERDIQKVFSEIENSIGKSGGEETPPYNETPNGGETSPGTEAWEDIKSRDRIHVEFSKIDKVMNLVGELFTERSSMREGLRHQDNMILKIRKINELAEKLKTDPTKEYYSELSNTIQELRHFADLQAETATESIGQLSRVLDELRDDILDLRLVPIEETLRRLWRTIRDALRYYKEDRGGEGLKKANLNIDGGDVEVDKIIVDGLHQPLIHIVRNCVAHGIEPVKERRRLGKPEEGVIEVKAAYHGGRFQIEIQDDGRGIDPETIALKAAEKGIRKKTEIDQMTEEEKLELIFEPGFTIADKQNPLFGGGVGLDVVMKKITELKGMIKVSSKPGHGTSFRLQLPLTLAMMKVLLFEISGEQLALPHFAMKEVLDFHENMVQFSGNREIILHQDQPIPLLRLSRPISSRADNSAGKKVLVFSSIDQSIGLFVDKVCGGQDAVIKPLGTLMPEAPRVLGVIFSEEKCVPVLSSVDLLELIQDENLASTAIGEADRIISESGMDTQPGEAAGYRILLADDDPLFRTELSTRLSSIGYGVTEAVDGSEAFEFVRNESFDLIITDIVMPKMDGYELARNIRKDQSVPIIMISSLDKEADKIRGFDAGIDLYFTKSDMDVLFKDLLNALRRFLK